MERQKETRTRIHMERRWESKRLGGTPERVGGPSSGTRRAKPARNLVSYSSDDNGHAGVLGDPEPSLPTPATPSYRAPVTPGADDWDRTSLPCEFCGLDFPADELILHQSGCNVELAHASVDYHYTIPTIPTTPTTTTTRIQHQPDDRRGHREPSRNAFSPRDPGNPAQRDPFAISDRLNPHLDASYCEPSRGPVHRLPCEICTELVEAERLPEHQHECLVQQLRAMRSFSSDPGSWTLDS
uniref:Uncharacterized protein LOC116957773 n=1 Tax=Petromyzon marinus TaxID=7757 RepID=A0AAJ7UJL0_PETMA|nr:uncharacterized protein LOC116957773 [Petromyzon marinus]